MIPDYSLSEVEIFRQATLECIYGSNSLSVFSTEWGRKFRTDLPSWVPDWGAPGGFTYETRAAVVELYNACFAEDGATESTVRLEEGALKVKSCRFGEISWMSEVMWGGDDTDMSENSPHVVEFVLQQGKQQLLGNHLCGSHLRIKFEHCGPPGSSRGRVGLCRVGA
jgi:hypothetical protein